MMDVRALLARDTVRASVTAPVAALPFYINARPAGLIFPRTLAWLKKPTFQSRFVITDKTVELALRSEDKNELSEELTLLATQLHEAKAFYQWRDEMLDVVDIKTGDILTQTERGLFRFFGMQTTCVHAVAKKGNAWIVAKRSATKQVDAGLFDTLSGGLVAAGETPIEALLRETQEEAGLTRDNYSVGTPFEFLVTRDVKEGWMREKTLVYPIILKEDASLLNQDGEVEGFYTMTDNELLNEIEAKHLTLDASLAFLKTLCA